MRWKEIVKETELRKPTPAERKQFNRLEAKRDSDYFSMSETELAQWRSLYSVVVKWDRANMPVAKETIEELLYQWDNYNADDVWNGGRLELEKKLIAASKKLKHRVSGTLYRGQGIADELFLKLQNGETVTVPKIQTLLSSWTNIQHVAEHFAEVAAELHGYNSVMIAYPADQLEVVVDVTRLPTMRGEIPFNESEVICMHQSLILGPHNTILYPHTGD